MSPPHDHRHQCAGHGHAGHGHGAHHGHAHGHGHGHAGHNHTAGADARALTRALLLVGGYLLVEVAGAWWFNSLALLSDAGHMLTDVAALAIALAAIRFGRRPADNLRTFGYRRFEILAAAFNAILLFMVAIYVFVEAIRRFRAPEPVSADGMLTVAVLGLIVNLVAMRLLAHGQDSSLTVKGAYLEVWADMIGSVGVIAGAVVIAFTGWAWVDPVIAVGVALWVLPRTWALLRITLQVLLEGVPPGLALPEVRAALNALDGVADVHDLHIWSLTTDAVNCTVHLAVDTGSDAHEVRRAAAGLLTTHYAISHITIQTETPGERCGEPEQLHP